VFIAAEKRARRMPENPVEHLRKHPVPFPYLLDEDRKVTKAYGVYHRVGLEGVNIARPATFVVDRGGMVRFLYVGMNQTDRIPLDAVLEVIGNLKG
jgi:peroxiredoxin